MPIPADHDDEEDRTEGDASRVAVGGVTRGRQDERAATAAASSVMAPIAAIDATTGSGEQGEERPDLHDEDDRVARVRCTSPRTARNP